MSSFICFLLSQYLYNHGWIIHLNCNAIFLSISHIRVKPMSFWLSDYTGLVGLKLVNHRSEADFILQSTSPQETV